MLMHSMIPSPQQPALALRPPRCPAPTRVHAVVGLQLVLQAELLAAAVALVGFLPSVDALVALQRALVPEAAAAELAFVGVVTCKHVWVSPMVGMWGAVWGHSSGLRTQSPLPASVPHRSAAQHPDK